MLIGFYDKEKNDGEKVCSERPSNDYLVFINGRVLTKSPVVIPF